LFTKSSLVAFNCCWSVSMPVLLSEVADGVGRVTLNDPERANVLSGAMMAALAEVLAAWAESEAVRVVVVDAAGRVFCAGHDLAEVRGLDAAGQAALFAQCAALMTAIVAFPKPVMACVRGAAVAAGCQLVTSCDLAYAASGSRFAVSGIDLGFFCSTPGVALGRAVGKKAAQEMLFSGRFVAADEAAAMGLINRAVPAEELDLVVDGMARVIAAKAPAAIRLGKATFRAQMGLDLAAAYEVAGAAMVENLRFAETLAGIDGFLRR
jgi:enoyl-CoA hydratase/carnithine racemase